MSDDYFSGLLEQIQWVAVFEKAIVIAIIIVLSGVFLRIRAQIIYGRA